MNYRLGSTRLIELIYQAIEIIKRNTKVNNVNAFLK